MSSAFLSALRAHQPTSPALSARPRWLYVPYDQLTDQLGPLATEPPDALGIILIESLWKPRQRPYHKQKLALILTNQRHFAIEQAARGVAVRYITTALPYADALAPLAAELHALGQRPIEVMRPAERELRAQLAPLIAAQRLIELTHTGWLTSPADFLTSQGNKTPWRMDAFYRH
jgi:deoxyribodipyrimidine photolyase-related protein